MAKWIFFLQPWSRVSGGPSGFLCNLCGSGSGARRRDSIGRTITACPCRKSFWAISDFRRPSAKPGLREEVSNLWNYAFMDTSSEIISFSNMLSNGFQPV